VRFLVVPLFVCLLGGVGWFVAYAFVCVCVCVLAFLGLVVCVSGWGVTIEIYSVGDQREPGKGKKGTMEGAGFRGSNGVFGVGVDGEAQSVCMYLCLFILTAVDDIRAALYQLQVVLWTTNGASNTLRRDMVDIYAIHSLHTYHHQHDTK
jgi:hypothetical protein